MRIQIRYIAAVTRAEEEANKVYENVTQGEEEPNKVP